MTAESGSWRMEPGMGKGIRIRVFLMPLASFADL